MPAWDPVFALNCFTKSMMFTPCGPSAFPTGGAGVACPAGTCSLTIAVTGFAISEPSAASSPVPRMSAARTALRIRALAFVGQHFLHGSAKVRERPLSDLHDLAH